MYITQRKALSSQIDTDIYISWLSIMLLYHFFHGEVQTDQYKAFFVWKRYFITNFCKVSEKKLKKCDLLMWLREEFRWRNIGWLGIWITSDLYLLVFTIYFQSNGHQDRNCQTSNSTPNSLEEVPKSTYEFQQDWKLFSL